MDNGRLRFVFLVDVTVFSMRYDKPHDYLCWDLHNLNTIKIPQQRHRNVFCSCQVDR